MITVAAKSLKTLEISQVLVFFHISYCFLHGSVYKLCIVWPVQPKQYTVYTTMQKTVGNKKL